MTIALGLNCVDGIVVLADSLETDGMSKRYVDKIWSYQVRDEWGITIASAGEADLADSFTDNLDGILGTEGFDQIKLMSKLRIAIAQTRKTYPDSQLAMIIGVFGPPPFRKIYRVADTSMHLGPIRYYEALGIGSSLVKFLCSQLFTPFVMVDEAIRLGIFALTRCTEHVDGCGGPISIIACKSDSKEWLYEHPEKVLAMQSEFPAQDFKHCLVDCWVANNASVQKIEHDRYREYEGGGFVRFKIQGGRGSLETKPSASRKSKQRK